jgi:hypothetical protein
MLLKDKQTGTLVAILDVESLINPAKAHTSGRDQEGQEEQEPEQFAKQDLIFPSGEPLPKCWTDAQYQLEQHN